MSFLILLFLLATGVEVFACTTCNRPLQKALFDASFLKLLLWMALPFLFVWALVIKIHKLK